jgi:hypothetical protein
MPRTDDTPDPGIGSCTITVNDQRNISYSCDPVEPDANNNISFTLQSTGPTKTWSFNPNNPINIANPNDFSWSLASPTQLNVTDTSADEKTIPQHNYTIMIQSQSGEQAEFDPIIKDRTTQMA